MTDAVEVITRNEVHVAAVDDVLRSHAAGSRIRVTREDFDDLSALGAVRPVPVELRHPLDHDGDGKPGGALVLVPKHRGAGQWAVVKAGTNEIVSGDERFDSRDAAQDWIDWRPNGAEDVTD